MSHFVGAAVVPSCLALTDLLARYDENREVPKYLEATKAQAIERTRESIENYRQTVYARYIADPAEYAKTTTNAAHIAYLRDQFPLKLDWTDAEVYTDAVLFKEPDDLDADGNIYSTRNPESKWDWYAIGGRWDGTFGRNRFSSVAEAREAFDAHEFPPRVLVLPDGRWLEKGEMGWFGMSHGDVTDEQWRLDFFAALDATALTHPSSSVLVVDFHI